MENEKLVELIKDKVNVKDNMADLYKQNRGIIYKYCLRYSGTNEIDDLMQEAYFILCDAVQSFDPSRGLFASWLGKCICYQMPRRLISLNLIRLPTHIGEKCSQYERYMIKFSKEHGHDPSDQEIMEAMGINAKDLKSIKKAIQVTDRRSLDDVVSSVEGITLLETIADETDYYEIIDTALDQKVYADVLKDALSELTDKQREVLSLRMQGLSMDRVKERLNLKSRQVVDVREKTGLKTLRNKLYEKGVLQMLYEDAYRGSLTAFNQTHTSTPERIAIRHLSQNASTVGAC